jgi:pimeloyl-ACP methyl ester carboxylesterase
MGKVALIGHGLGALVGLHFTLKYPNVVDRIMAVNARLIWIWLIRACAPIR